MCIITTTAAMSYFSRASIGFDGCDSMDDGPAESSALNAGYVGKRSTLSLVPSTTRSRALCKCPAKRSSTSTAMSSAGYRPPGRLHQKVEAFQRLHLLDEIFCRPMSSRISCDCTYRLLQDAVRDSTIPDTLYLREDGGRLVVYGMVEVSVSEPFSKLVTKVCKATCFVRQQRLMLYRARGHRASTSRALGRDRGIPLEGDPSLRSKIGRAHV